MQVEKLVEDYRNGTLENIHYGQICMVNESGEVLHEVGDVHTTTFLRSAAKPIQTLPVFMHDADELYGISGEEAALFMASQRGEVYHVEGLKSLQKKLNIQEETLICSASYPLNDPPKEKYIYEHREKRKLLHNCAGKHFGALALTKALGAPIDDYGALMSPAQQFSLEAMAYMTETSKEKIKLGTDGCGFPVHAVPLHAIAKAYMKLACPDVMEDVAYRKAAEKVGNLMNAHPEMIASHDFVCTVLLNDPNIIAKGGAKGVYGIGLRKEQIGISLKVIDGSEAVWPNIIARILEQINYDNKQTIEALYTLSPKEIKNDGNTVVGERKALFHL